MPIINTVGFSHPLTFTIIAAHNTFSLTYLLLAVAVAYPAFHKKSWLIPVAVTTVWMTINVNIISILNIPATISIVTIFPHGWLEFTAIVYWTNAICKATQNNNPPKTIGTPTFRDYLKVLTKPKQFVILVKTDVHFSFKTTKLSFKTLCRNLKKTYIITLILIATAALIETYITPNVMLLVSNL